jgi:3-methyladenine DNA glycosylase AlkD
MNYRDAQRMLHQYASPAKARALKAFFKTGAGQYSEGDIFIGVKVPEIRAVSRAFKDLDPEEIDKLLCSPIHEERLLALLILIHRYDAGTELARKAIVRQYLKHTVHINNWDLVDLSAPKLLGDWLKNKDRGILKKLARSRNIWERRIAIVATHAFIREKQLDDTLRIARILLDDKEDLIHKATGWMLREAGKRDIQALKDFLQQHHTHMPRTMLRYAIERFPENERQAYLQK